MYCPNCAASIDGVQKFCRSCGANVSLVPQALTGQLPETTVGVSVGRHRRRRGRDHRPPSVENATTTFFVGIGFILAAITIMRYMPGGFTWGWSFFIPALSCMGKGVGEYLRWRELERQRLGQPMPQPGLNAAYANPPLIQSDPGGVQNSAPTTSTLAPPHSITEDTTRHLASSREGE